MYLINRVALCSAFIIFFSIPHCFNEAFSYGKNMNERNVAIVTMDDNEKEMEVRSGDIIQIELKALGSAGYWWYFDNLEPEYFDLLSKETKPLSEDKIGAPVLCIWKIKAKKKGRREIKMNCYRNWEGKEKSIERFMIKLNIKE